MGIGFLNFDKWKLAQVGEGLHNNVYSRYSGKKASVMELVRLQVS